ncbi:MAG: glycosyltransferase family 4 protein, partial [Phycisphaerales bacterium JB047]
MKSPRLRIAIVSREYPPFFGGGIGTYARWIVPALTQAGVRVHVITQAYDRVRPRVEVDGLVTVHRVPTGMGKGGWTNAAIRFSTHAGRIASALHRTGQIDAVEFAECEGAALMPLLFNRHRPPTIVQLHTPSEQLFVLRSLSSPVLDTPHRVYFETERMAMRLADEILAPSRFIASWAHAHYQLPRMPSVIPYATGPLPAPPPPAPVGTPPTVFYAGRIEPRKGVESLILGFNRVAADHPSVQLRLAGADTSGAPGGGSMRAYLQSLVEPQAQGRVHFLGRLNQSAMGEEFARSLICTIPSLWENFPNTCIESMSNARAVLVSDQGGMNEMVGDTDAGRSFIAGDPDDLSRVLGEMLEEPRDRLIERGRIARGRIEHLCNPQRIAAQRIEHFTQIIERAKQHQPRPDT